MKLFEIFGVVKVDSSQAEKGLSEIENKGEKTAKSLDKLTAVGDKLSSIGEGLSDFGGKLSVGVTAPIVAAGASIMALTSKAADATDAIHKGSQRMGISMKAYQEMEYWASQNGLAHGSLENAVGRLNQRLGMAADGNKKYSEVLEKLGVDMESVKKGTLSTEDAFAQTIQKLSEMTNEQEKAALASELFGAKLSKDLLTVLQDGSLSLEEAKEKAEELGIVLGDEAVLAGVALTDAMDDMQRSLSAAVTEMGVELIPLMMDVFLPFMLEHAIPAVRELAEFIGRLVEKFTSLPEGVQKAIFIFTLLLASLGPILLIVGKMITGLGSFMGLLIKIGPLLKTGGLILTGLNLPMLIIIGTITALVGVGVLLYKNWDKIKETAVKLKDVIVKAWGVIKDITSKTFKAVGKFMVHPIENSKKAIKKIVDQIKKMFKFKIEFPDIKLPRIFGGKGYKGTDADASGSTATRLFAKGGYMNKATEFARSKETSYIGGEAGAEGIVPLEGRHMTPFAEAVADMIKANVNQGSYEKTEINVESLVVREEADVRKIAEELEKMRRNKSRWRGSLNV